MHIFWGKEADAVLLMLGAGREAKAGSRTWAGARANLLNVAATGPRGRDRLLLVSAFAVALLTILGAVGERLGMDRLLKSNTSKTCTHSLFRQGCMLYELIPNTPEHRLLPLIEAFARAVSKAALPQIPCCWACTVSANMVLTRVSSTLLSFVPRSLRVTRVVPTPERVAIEASPRSTTAACPVCGNWSQRVHSSYGRMLHDLRGRVAQ